MMTATLQHTLQTQLHAQVTAPAFDRLLQDYVTYHLVFLLLGTPAALLIALVAAFAWRRVLTLRARPEWRAERTLTTWLAAVSTATGLFLCLVLVGNVSNVISPRQGFSSLVTTLPVPPQGGQLASVRSTADLWITSGRADVPQILTDHIRQRLAWQQPKAVMCGLLTLTLATLTIRRWRRLSGQPAFITRLALAAAVPTIHLLTLMTLANTQAAFAPLTLTVING